MCVALGNSVLKLKKKKEKQVKSGNFFDGPFSNLVFRFFSILKIAFSIKQFERFLMVCWETVHMVS